MYNQPQPSALGEPPASGCSNTTAYGAPPPSNGYYASPQPPPPTASGYPPPPQSSSYAPQSPQGHPLPPTFHAAPFGGAEPEYSGGMAGWPGGASLFGGVRRGPQATPPLSTYGSHAISRMEGVRSATDPTAPTGMTALAAPSLRLDWAGNWVHARIRACHGYRISDQRVRTGGRAERLPVACV